MTVIYILKVKEDKVRSAMNVLPQNTVDCSQPGNQTTPIKLLPAITAFAYKLNKHCAAAPRRSLIV